MKMRYVPWGTPGSQAAFLFGVPAPSSYADGKKGNFLDASYYRAMGRPLPFPPPFAATDDCFALTAPVGQYPQGASYYGLNDAAGNVSVWTADQITAGMKAFAPNVLGDGYVAMGSNWLFSAALEMDLPLPFHPEPGGVDYVGIRLVVPSE
jgi:hypothetical protein